MHRLIEILTASKASASDSDLFANDWFRRAKRHIHNQHQHWWQQNILASPSLRPAYTSTPSLHMQFYLELQPFRGQRLITKARVNDLFLFNTNQHAISISCPLCLRTFESAPRLHFLVQCEQLAHIRSNHPRIFQHIRAHSLDHQLSAILLATTPLSTNMSFIHDVGVYLVNLKNHSDWKSRKISSN